MSMMRGRPGALVVVVGLAGALVAGPVSTSSAQAPTKPRPKVVIVPEPKLSPQQYFSPNGDGDTDRVGVVFRLRGKARVSVVIRPLSSDSHTSPQEGVATKEVVRRAEVGIRKPGRRTWWWAGRDDDGRVVDDGSYEITVKAKPLTKRRTAGSITQVVDSHTTFHQSDDYGPTITLSRTALYPDTTAIKDLVAISANELPGGRWDPEGAVPQLTITDAGGREVRRQSYPAYLEWDGTDASGARVPNGPYTVRADWSDNYGNRLSRSATLVVASGSLVRQEWSQTYDDPAALLLQNGQTCFYPVRDCDSRAVAGASARFATGLAFGPRSRAQFAVDVPGLRPLNSLVDQARVSVTGGPATAGDTTSTGTLVLLGAAVTPVPPGDGTTASGWVRLGTAAASGRLGWTFDSTSGGYDVDSFTVDVVHWAPPA